MQKEPINLYRRSWCEDSDAAVGYFNSAGIAYTEIDIEIDEKAGEGVKFIAGGHHITPTLLYSMHAIVFDPWDEARFQRWWALASSE